MKRTSPEEPIRIARWLFLAVRFGFRRTRKRVASTHRKRAAWRLYFLSTSNLTLDELADQGGVLIDEQHRGRLVDVVLPSGQGTFGIYQDLHGFADGAALTDAIKSRCRTAFGTPGYSLISKLYKDKNSRSAAKKFVAARRNYYVNRARIMAAAKGLKPLERAIARFATVYAAGASPSITASSPGAERIFCGQSLAVSLMAYFKPGARPIKSPLSASN